MPVPEASWWVVERSAECDGGVPASRQPVSELGVIRNFGTRQNKSGNLNPYRFRVFVISRKEAKRFLFLLFLKGGKVANA